MGRVELSLVKLGNSERDRRGRRALSKFSVFERFEGRARAGRPKELDARAREN